MLHESASRPRTEAASPLGIGPCSPGAAEGSTPGFVNPEMSSFFSPPAGKPLPESEPRLLFILIVNQQTHCKHLSG